MVICAPAILCLNGVGRWREPGLFPFLGCHNEDLRFQAEPRLTLVFHGGVSCSYIGLCALGMIVDILCEKSAPPLGS